MTTRAARVQSSADPYISLFFAAMLGLGIVILAGHVQADSLHAAAHDTRHATGFPCH